MSQTMSPTYNKPLPATTPETMPFWDAARRHELQIQRCTACGHRWFPPSLLCPECLSEAFEWQVVSGQGTLFSFVIFHRPYHAGYKGEVPYNVSIVELAEGPRLLTNVVGCPNDALEIGMPLEVVFDDVTDEVSLPKFQPRAG
jgi:uncharacterized OB-fold protein